MLLFTLTKPDLIFVICVGSVILAGVIVYLLTPIIKRKQFAEARANLKKREESFRANLENLREKKAEDQKVK